MTKMDLKSQTLTIILIFGLYSAHCIYLPNGGEKDGDGNAPTPQFDPEPLSSRIDDLLFLDNEPSDNGSHEGQQDKSQPPASESFASILFDEDDDDYHYIYSYEDDDDQHQENSNTSEHNPDLIVSDTSKNFSFVISGNFVEGHPSNISYSDSTGTHFQSNSRESGRRKRGSSDIELQGFIDEAVRLTNERRKILGLSQLEFDRELTIGAQQWSEHEARAIQQSHSCGPCQSYSEVLAHKRTAGAPSKGSRAAKWAVSRWFGENPYIPESDIIQEADLAKIGVGITYRHKSGSGDEGFNHIFAVGRFSRK